MSLVVLWEDSHALAVLKPAPLLTEAPAGIPSLAEMVRQYIREKYAKPAGVYLGIPHRLDRPVSGVVVFARNSKAAAALGGQFAERKPTKVYWAAVRGVPEPEAGSWADWLVKIPDEARAVVGTPETPGAKEATLDYRVLMRLPDGNALLELRPRTGRMHQLRVQSASRGHPVLGDVLYGSDAPFGPVPELPRERVIALHARELTFFHPSGPRREEAITVTAPLPKAWADVGIPAELLAGDGPASTDGVGSPDRLPDTDATPQENPG